VTGTIGLDLPKEVLRIERDWSTGDICQSVSISISISISPSNPPTSGSEKGEALI